MALRSTLENSNKRKISVHIGEIRPNKFNKYPMDDVAELANQIISMKEQLQPGEAYEDSLDDGKRFTLTSGERRYRAIKSLYDQGKHDGMMDIIVISKPNNIWEERRRIRSANIYRERSIETKIMEVSECLEEYEHLCEIGERPKGLKRDWIGDQLGLNGRTIDRLIAKTKSNSEGTDTNIKTNQKEESYKIFYDDIAHRIGSRLQTATKITKHEIKIKFTDTEDLNRILEALDFLEETLE